MQCIAKSWGLVTKKINNALLIENKEGGLLYDVTQIITPINFEDKRYTPPTVHIIEGTTSEQPMTTGLAGKRRMKTSFDFFCMDYDKDLLQGQIKVKNLAGRVFNSLLKNKNLPVDDDEDNHRFFTSCQLVGLQLVGELNLTQIRPRVPVACLTVDFYYYIDEIPCQKD